MKDLYVTPKDVEKFIEDRGALAQASRDAYRTAIELFMRLRIPIDANCLREFDKRLANSTSRRAAKDERYSPATRSLYCSALVSYLQWMEAEDRLDDITILTRSVVRMKDLRKRTGMRPDRKSMKEPAPGLARAIGYYDTIIMPADPLDRLDLLRNRALVAALWDTGGRIGTILQLKRSSFDRDEVQPVRITGKRGKPYLHTFQDDSIRAIRAYLRERGKGGSEWLFISHRKSKGQPVTRMTAWRIVKHAAKELKIEGNASPHMIRHARAIQLLHDGMPLEMVSQFLEHDNPTVTRQYYARWMPDALGEHVTQYHKPIADAVRDTYRE